MTRNQLKNILKHAAGQYFKELFSETAHLDRSEKIEIPQENIQRASNIIVELKAGLDAQAATLNKLMKMDEKQGTAQRYAAFAETNKEAELAIRVEIESAMREELVAQSSKNKAIRILFSLIIWVVTISLGAALGSYFKEIVTFFS